MTPRFIFPICFIGSFIDYASLPRIAMPTRAVHNVPRRILLITGKPHRRDTQRRCTDSRGIVYDAHRLVEPPSTSRREATRGNQYKYQLVDSVLGIDFSQCAVEERGICGETKASCLSMVADARQCPPDHCSTGARRSQCKQYSYTCILTSAAHNGRVGRHMGPSATWTASQDRTRTCKVPEPGKRCK